VGAHQGRPDTLIAARVVAIIAAVPLNSFP